MWRAASFVAVALAVLMSAVAQTPLERAKNDDLSFVPKDDPVMARAIQRARSSLDQFLEILKSPPDYVRSAAVKVGIAEGKDTEFFWLGSLFQEGERFHGQINNQPRIVDNVRMGQRYSFTRADIVHWTYVDTRTKRMMGNFTACALLTREPPEQAAAFRQQYGLQCDPL